MRRFWKRWVYDSTHAPVEWKNDPHEVFKPIGRFALVLFGSLVPMVMILVRSGVLHRLDEGSDQIGWVFGVTAFGFVIAWLMGVVFGTVAKEESFVKYILVGSVPPANVTIFYYTVQAVE